MTSSRKDTGNKKTKVGSLGISDNHRDERMVGKPERREEKPVSGSPGRGVARVSTEKLLLVRVKVLPLGLVTRGSLVGCFFFLPNFLCISGNWAVWPWTSSLITTATSRNCYERPVVSVHQTGPLWNLLLEFQCFSMLSKYMTLEKRSPFQQPMLGQLDHHIFNKKPRDAAQG